MTEKGRGGGDLVETFELHEITSLPYFRAPMSYQVMGIWIYIVGFQRRVKVPSVRSILYSTTT
jgi:hypothetical protein